MKKTTTRESVMQSLAGEVIDSKAVRHMVAGEYEDMSLMLVTNRSKYGDLYSVTSKVEGNCGETLWVDSTSDYNEAKAFFDNAKNL